MPVWPAGQTVVILHRTVTVTKDEYGDDVYAESPEIIKNCSVQPGGSTEQIQGTQMVTSDVVVYMPPGTGIVETDKLVINGEEFEVDGVTPAGTSPFTGSAGLVIVRANRITGASV